MANEPAEEDTFKILVATDTHLGYNEKDPIRGNVYKEVLAVLICFSEDNFDRLTSEKVLAGLCRLSLCCMMLPLMMPVRLHCH